MNSEVQITEYGPFSANYKSAKLSELCIEKTGVQTGPFGSQLHNEDYVDVGTPIITVEHLGENRINHQNTPFVSDKDKARLSKYHLQEGDIVFSRVGSVDRRALVREAENGWLFSGRCLRVRVNKSKIDPLYLSYFFGLESFKNYIRSIAVGATMPSINTKILSDIPIYYPESLDEQRRIAKIFYTNDEKIELNRQTNQTLEQIAQALFKSWFVDFDPVKAKIAAKQAGGNAEQIERAAMAAISGKTDPELDQLTPEQYQNLKTTAALFPDELVDSELGEIPKGWRLGCLSDLIVQRNERIKASDETKLLPYVPIDCISAKSLFLKEYKNGEEAKSSLTKIYKGDFIFGAMRPYFHKVCIAPFDATTRTTAFVLTPRQATDFSFSILKLHEKDTIDFATLNSTGSTIPYAKWDSSLSEMNIVLPPANLRERFDQLVKPLLDSIPPKIFECKNLESLRDSLLPKLLSGGFEND